MKYVSGDEKRIILEIADQTNININGDLMRVLDIGERLCVSYGNYTIQTVLLSDEDYAIIKKILDDLNVVERKYFVNMLSEQVKTLDEEENRRL